LSLENLFSGSFGLPTYQLHMLCDGHGLAGDAVSDFIVNRYPDTLSKLLITAIEEYRALEGETHIIMEEDNEDSSPVMR